MTKWHRAVEGRPPSFAGKTMKRKTPPDSTVLHQKLSDLTPDARNANKGTARGAAMIRASLRDYGAGRSILLDKNGAIIAGNKTVENAGALGHKDVLIVQTDGTQLVAVQRTDLDLKDPRARQLAIADNRAGEVSLEWDAEMLKALSGEGVDLGPFWTGDELEKLLPTSKDLLTEEDEVPEPPAEPKSKLGDLYILGEHRLLCGDSTQIGDVERLMGGQKADMVFTDPPYGISAVAVDGTTGGMAHWSGKQSPMMRGKVDGDKPFGKSDGGSGTTRKGPMKRAIVKANLYAPIIGDDSTGTALAAHALCVALKVKSMIFWGGNYYADKLPPSSCWIVWDKDNGESFFADAELAWTNQKTAVRIFKHQWNGLIKASERGEKRCHPTQKPIALAAWCFEHYGEPKAILDLFGGSGSTLIACEKTGRKCFMMEISPAYCDVIVERWQNATGKKAVLDGA